jgi:hypothetical protein
VTASVGAIDGIISAAALAASSDSKMTIEVPELPFRVQYPATKP